MLSFRWLATGALLIGACHAGRGGVADVGNIDASAPDTFDGAMRDGQGGGYDGPRAVPSALFPGAGARGICPDPSLRVSFVGQPVLGRTGKVQVWNVAQPAAPAVVVDMAAATVTETIGGSTFNLPRPVYVDGNDVVVHLPARALGYGKTFYVTVDAGAILDPGGVPVVITDDATWRFTTVAGAPADLAALTVAADGSAQFCSVQGAIDALPAGNMIATTITIGQATYREVVYFTGKSNVTLHGMDRTGTVIMGTNNNNLNPTSKGRALVGVDNSSAVVIENLTIQNVTPQGGSQAEALRLGGCDKCIVRDANILSLQDTLQWSGRIYAANCLIAGNVDFIWGTGVAYFNKCELKTVGRAGYNVQSRNASASANGYVFVDSRLTSDPGITGDVLARIDVSTFPFSHVAYINCELGSHIAPSGWLVTGAAAGPPATLRFWEFESRDPAGNLIDVSQRMAGSTQLTAEEALMMRDPSVVLGGWIPQ